MGIARWEPLFRQAPCANLCETLVPTTPERSNAFDCEQDRSNDQSSHGAQSDSEDSTLKSSAPPVKPYELMPAAVHMVSAS